MQLCLVGRLNERLPVLGAEYNVQVIFCNRLPHMAEVITPFQGFVVRYNFQIHRAAPYAKLYRPFRDKDILI